MHLICNPQANFIGGWSYITVLYIIIIEKNFAYSNSRFMFSAQFVRKCDKLFMFRNVFS